MHTVSPQNPDLTAAGAGRPDVAAGTSRASNPGRSLPGNGECAGSSAADHPSGCDRRRTHQRIRSPDGGDYGSEGWGFESLQARKPIRP